MKAFGDYFHEVVADRAIRLKPPTRLTIIGRRTIVNLPEFGLKQVLAKVDTGAYVSAIHATNIKEKEVDGRMVLEFNLLDGHGRAEKSKVCTAHDYRAVRIKSSNGTYSTRYKIKNASIHYRAE